MFEMLFFICITRRSQEIWLHEKLIRKVYILPFVFNNKLGNFKRVRFWRRNGTNKEFNVKSEKREWLSNITFVQRNKGYL